MNLKRLQEALSKLGEALEPDALDLACLQSTDTGDELRCCFAIGLGSEGIDHCPRAATRLYLEVQGWSAEFALHPRCSQHPMEPTPNPEEAGSPLWLEREVIEIQADLHDPRAAARAVQRAISIAQLQLQGGPP